MPFPLPPEPFDVTVKVATATGAAATVAPTFAAVAGKRNWLKGFHVMGGGATGASIIVITVTGLLGGTITYNMAVLAGAAAPVNAQGGLLIDLPYPIPASDVNTAITVSAASFGAGNTIATVNMYGFVEK